MEKNQRTQGQEIKKDGEERPERQRQERNGSYIWHVDPKDWFIVIDGRVGE